MGNKKSKKKRIDVVYSTNPDYDYSHDNDGNDDTLDPSEQLLEAKLEKKGRGGKTAVIIDGFIGSDDDLKDLGKVLKTKCGVGGSVKNGQIILQGDVRDKAMELLKSDGYKVKRVGG